MKLVDVLLSANLMLAGSFAAFAQDVTLLGGDLNETIRDGATVSGVIVVGIIGAGDPVVGQLSVSAALPSQWAGSEICVFVISSDGLYEARNTYAISPDWPGGNAPIPYPTVHLDRLTSFAQGNITAMTRLGACGVGSEQNVAPTYWNSRPTNMPHRFTMMINSFRADEVFLYIGAAFDAPAIMCNKITLGVQTAYDMICEFDMPDTAAQEVEIEINRVHGGIMAPPEFIVLQAGKTQ